MSSTLFRLPQAPVIATENGSIPDDRFYVVGTDGKGVYCHGCPGAPIPKTATVLKDGRTPWDWNTLADSDPDIALACQPHEWAGEPTARNLSRMKFAKLVAEDVEVAKQRDRLVR